MTDGVSSPVVNVRRRLCIRERLTVAIVVAALVCVTALTACNVLSDNSGRKEAAVSTCLRKQGIVPISSGSHEIPPGMTPTRLASALKKCGVRSGQFSGATEAGVNNPVKRAVVERELRKISACLREHGFPVTTPKNVYYPPVFNANGVNTKSTQFREANRECRRRFIEDIRKLGYGYGGEHGGKVSSGAATLLPGSSSRAAALAQCAHKYGATAVGTGALLGAQVPSHIPLSHLKAMLKNCDFGRLTQE